MVLSNWKLKLPKVEIPPEISLFPLSVLFDLLHGTRSLDQDLTNPKALFSKLLVMLYHQRKMRST